MKVLDVIISFLLLIILFPLMIVISAGIFFSDGFPVFFIQQRVGEKWKTFKIIKFRTMKNQVNKSTIGIESKSCLIFFGKFLRTTHLDELPQLINIIKGEMIFVGPRPEIVNIAKKYDLKSKKIFDFKPGLTSPASIAFRNESSMFEGVKNKDEFYLSEIVPKKIAIDIDYFSKRTWISDFLVVIKTLISLFSHQFQDR